MIKKNSEGHKSDYKQVLCAFLLTLMSYFSLITVSKFKLHSYQTIIGIEVAIINFIDTIWLFEFHLGINWIEIFNRIEKGWILVRENERQKEMSKLYSSGTVLFSFYHKS